MQSPQLVAHLARRFGAGEENLATEGLQFVLSRSEPARSALRVFTAGLGVPLSERAVFKTQVQAADGSIPDLVGQDEHGQPLIVEAKFWAGLTENQPVSYIAQLPEAGPGVLLFVAPEQRIAPLWAELQRRCQSASVPFEPADTGSPVKLARIGLERRLAAVSWRTLLARIERAVRDGREEETLADVRQLMGLCERMDEEAFLPVQSADLTGDAGRKVVQFCSLVDAVGQDLVAQPYADGTGLRTAAGHGWYGRYLRLHGHIVLVHFSAHKWGKRAATPLWLNYYGAAGKTPATVLRAALAPLELSSPSRLFLSAQGDLEIPLFLPVGTERDGVIEAVRDQVAGVAALISGVAPPEATSSAVE